MIQFLEGLFNEVPVDLEVSEFMEVFEEGLSWDEACAESFEVIGVSLAVDELETGIMSDGDEGSESNFGGVIYRCEHGFTAEEAADGDAVEAADELIIFPGFDAVNDAEFMELFVAIDHLRQDPGGLEFGATRLTFEDGSHAMGAICHDFAEGGICAEFEVMVTHGSFKRGGEVEFVRVEDEAFFWGEPPDEVSFFIGPGEDAISISSVNDFGVEGAAGSEEAVFIGNRVRRKIVALNPAVSVAI